MSAVVPKAGRTRSVSPPDFPATVCSGTVTVMSSCYGVENSDRKPIQVEVFPEGVPAAYVRVQAGSTKNLGNYESLRVDVAITLPCLVPEIDEVQKRLGNTVAQMLEDELEAYGAASAPEAQA